jgi:hypothetical protein
MSLGRIRARPSCTVACGPHPQRRLGQCAQCVRPTACRASLGLRGLRRRGADGGGTTVAEVEQKTTLEHPRRRGYPSGMEVDAIAHRSSLSMGRGRKTRSAAVFFNEARAPVAGGGPMSGWRERELGSTFHRRKSGKRGHRLCSPWKRSRRRRRPDSDSGALGQRRSALTTDNDAARTAGRRGRDGCRDTGARSR